MCDLYVTDGPDAGTDQDGKLFDRAPYALDLKKGDLSFTALSNHFASQSHQTRCREDEAAYVRDAAATLQQAGKNVLVAGDLNDFEFSSAAGDPDAGQRPGEPVERRRRPARPTRTSSTATCRRSTTSSSRRA